jgi:hypothetical protein
MPTVKGQTRLLSTDGCFILTVAHRKHAGSSGDSSRQFNLKVCKRDDNQLRTKNLKLNIGDTLSVFKMKPHDSVSVMMSSIDTLRSTREMHTMRVTQFSALAPRSAKTVSRARVCCVLNTSI